MTNNLPVKAENSRALAVRRHQNTTPSRSMRTPWRWGLFIIFSFFGLGGVISAMAPLSTAVTALGSVSTEGTVQTIQPLERGIVSKVLISEGEKVQAGQELLLLETTQTEGELDASLQRLRQAAAREERLIAEQQSRSDFVFRHVSLQDQNDPEVLRILQAETDLFQARIQTHSVRKSILRQRISQQNNQIKGLRTQLSGLVEQSRLLSPEVDNLENAATEGLVTRAQVLQAKRELAEVGGQIGQTEAEIARIQDTISETNIELSGLTASRLEEISQELTVAQTERRVAEETHFGLKDKLDKRTILAPISGLVMNLKQSSAGGVVTPGETMLEIVPVQTRTLVEVQVRPVDIDMVNEGQAASVLFSALPSSQAFPVDGTVSRISANVVIPQTQEPPHYLVQIEVSQRDLRDRLDGFEPVVGMPVQAFIEAGDRTLLDYIIAPATDLWRNALREQ